MYYGPDDEIAEALALYDRSVSYALMARSQFAECESDTSVSWAINQFMQKVFTSQLEKLLSSIRGDKCILTAARFLETQV